MKHTSVLESSGLWGSFGAPAPIRRGLLLPTVLPSGGAHQQVLPGFSRGYMHGHAVWWVRVGRGTQGRPHVCVMAAIPQSLGPCVLDPLSRALLLYCLLRGDGVCLPAVVLPASGALLLVLQPVLSPQVPSQLCIHTFCPQTCAPALPFVIM